jgi:2,4-dienoyl-CoA reductase-like NADH-dependent reductase (Old Yellow Enzyme family)
VIRFSILSAAALRVKDAGFDLVELHGGRGYLLMQFLSPYTNRRTDEYGGSLSNRMRFPLAVVRAVREAVNGFPVGYRLTGDEWLPGGFGPEEAATFAAELAKVGVTYLSVVTGSNEAPILNPDYKKLAADVSKRIKGRANMPIIVAGRITTPTQAEEVLAKGQADLIGLARTLLRDPLWPRKASEGIAEEIDVCDNCFGCTSNQAMGEPVICVLREK